MRRLENRLMVGLTLAILAISGFIAVGNYTGKLPSVFAYNTEGTVKIRLQQLV